MIARLQVDLPDARIVDCCCRGARAKWSQCSHKTTAVKQLAHLANAIRKEIVVPVISAIYLAVLSH